jgi:hypothetical protein
MRLDSGRKLLFCAWWGIAVSSFALGYAMALPWYGESAVLAGALVWLFAWSAQPSLCLGASVFVAALGLLLSAPEALMILGSSASLGLWDFANSGVPRATDANARAAQAALDNYRRSRLPYLILALGIGTPTAILGTGLTLRLPFFAMVFCVLACAFGIDRLVARLRKRR